jgi:hypothetical protein
MDKTTVPLAHTSTALRMEVAIVTDLLFVSTDHCPQCVLEDSSVQCNAWITLEGGGQDIVETCSACLIRTLDALPYLDNTHTITVEVHRAATLRPF